MSGAGGLPPRRRPAKKQLLQRRAGEPVLSAAVHDPAVRAAPRCAGFRSRGRGGGGGGGGFRGGSGPSGSNMAPLGTGGGYGAYGGGGYGGGGYGY